MKDDDIWDLAPDEDPASFKVVRKPRKPKPEDNTEE